MNVRMAEDFEEKRFGGEGAFALTGDQVKVFMRGGHNHRLIPYLLEIFRPVFRLKEEDWAEETAPAAAPAAVPAAPAPAAGKHA